MPTQSDKAGAFAAMHTPGHPIVIYNIWDAGSAKTVEAAGAPALATGSNPLAMAMGYPDGQIIPIDTLLMVVERIAASVSVPLSVDFEGGYAIDAASLAANTARLIKTGAIGVNFEDQIVGGTGLHPLSAQTARIAAVVAAGQAAGVPLFVNARTHGCLSQSPRRPTRKPAGRSNRPRAGLCRSRRIGLLCPRPDRPRPDIGADRHHHAARQPADQPKRPARRHTRSAGRCPPQPWPVPMARPNGSIGGRIRHGHRTSIPRQSPNPNPGLNFLFAQILIFPLQASSQTATKTARKGKDAWFLLCPSPNPNRVKINASPITANQAPPNPGRLGRCPVRHPNPPLPTPAR